MANILVKFYLSCILASWSDRMWFFALSMYFIEINRNTLLMNAVNGFLCSISIIFFGPVIGGLVDKYQRLPVVKLSLIIQNSTVALTCVIVVCAIIFRDAITPLWSGGFIYFLQGLMIFFNIISNLASVASKVAIERDWVIVIAKSLIDESDDEKAAKRKLTNINATVRRFDLSTSILAPMFAGAVMTFVNLSKRINGIIISALFLAGWNIVSFFFEYSLLASVYYETPELEKKVIKIEKSESKLLESLKTTKKLFTGWAVYFRQGLLLLPGFAFAFLFMTVLSFDSISIAYSKSQHLSESAISIMQAIGSIMGILGTIGFQLLHNKCKLKLKYCALVGSISQLVFIALCFTSIWMPGSPFELSTFTYSSNCSIIGDNNSTNLTLSFDNSTIVQEKSWLDRFLLSPCHSYVSILMLLFGTAFSRFGLWLLDLAINQLMQESVAEKERGVVGGVQSSLNKIFELIKYTVVMMLNQFPKYGYSVILSTGGVTFAFVLLVLYTFITSLKKYQEIPQAEATNKEIEIEMNQIETNEVES